MGWEGGTEIPGSGSKANVPSVRGGYRYFPELHKGGFVKLSSLKIFFKFSTFIVSLWT